MKEIKTLSYNLYMSQKKLKERRRIEKGINKVLKDRTYNIVLASLKQDGKTWDDLTQLEQIGLATAAKRKAEQDLELAMKLQLSGGQI